MFKQVKILRGKSQYDVFHVWLEALQKAFNAMGIPASPLSVPDSMTYVNDETLTFGFNMSRTWAIDNIEQNHFAWLVDHPIFHAEYFMPEIRKLAINQNHCIASCVSQDWTKCGRILYPNRDLHFLPHASTIFDAWAPDWDHRIIDVVFFGSICDPEGILDSIKNQTGRFWPFIEAIMNDHAYRQNYQPLDYLMLDALLAQKLDPAQTVIIMNAFFPLVDQYFRNLKRIELLQQIKDSTVYVFGNGPWKQFSLPSNIILHDSVPYREALGIMRQSRILLNHTPTLLGGGHERIFDAISNGCSVVTTYSDYLRKQFGMSSGIEFYDPMHLDNVNEKLVRILTNPDKGEIIKQGQELVQLKHTMHNRAQEIWKLANNKWQSPSPEPSEQLACAN